jgi:hypothetical protein
MHLRFGSKLLEVGEKFMQGMFGFLVRHPTISKAEILYLITLIINYQIKTLGLRGYASSFSGPSDVEWHAKMELLHFISLNNDLESKQLKTLKLFLQNYHDHSVALTLTQQLKSDHNSIIGNNGSDVIKRFWKYKQNFSFFDQATLVTIEETESEPESENVSDCDSTSQLCGFESQSPKRSRL